MPQDKDQSGAVIEAARIALKEMIAIIRPLNAQLLQSALAAIPKYGSGSSTEVDAPKPKQFATDFLTLVTLVRACANELSASELSEIGFCLGAMAHDLIGTHYHPNLASDQVIKWSEIRHEQSKGPKKHRDKSKLDGHRDKVVELFDKYHGGGERPRFRNWRQRMVDDLAAPDLSIAIDPDRLTAFLIKIGKLPDKKIGKLPDGRTK